MDWRVLIWAIPLLGCSPGSVTLDDLPPDEVPGEGWVDGPIAGWDTGDADDEDPLPWHQARLRIQEPRSATVVPLGEAQLFQAALMSPDGPLPTDQVEIVWSSTNDPGWLGLGPSFEDDSLDIGIHTLTAQAALPNGDVLAHSVGAVIVQHPLAGTYGGLYKVDVSASGLTVACTGATTVVINPYGDAGEGRGTCLVSILGNDFPLTWVFEPTIAADGTVGGTVGVSGFGLFTYNFPAEGEFLPNGDLRLDWQGPIPLIGSIEGFLIAPRVSLVSI